jgi:hypothetical protein
MPASTVNLVALCVERMLHSNQLSDCRREYDNDQSKTLSPNHHQMLARGNGKTLTATNLTRHTPFSQIAIDPCIRLFPSRPVNPFEPVF